MIRDRYRYRGSSPAGSSAPFVPTDIANLALWLDASDTATITQAAGLVSQWNDKSGLSNHVTQGTGARQPTTNSSTINGLNALNCPAGNKLMLMPSGLYSIPNGNNTVFAVTKQNGSAGDQWFLSTGLSPVYGYLYRTNGTNIRSFNNTGFAGNTDQTFSAGNTHITEFTRNGAGLTQTIDGIAGTPGTAVSGTAAAMYLFNFDGGAGSGFIGDSGEVLIYSRALSNAEKNQVGNYLGQKWLVSWTNI